MTEEILSYEAVLALLSEHARAGKVAALVSLERVPIRVPIWTQLQQLRPTQHAWKGRKRGRSALVA